MEQKKVTTKPVKKELTPREKENSYKKRIKELEDELMQAQLEITKYKEYAESMASKNKMLEDSINGLARKYSGITEFIQNATKVYHKSILMAFEEGLK